MQNSELRNIQLKCLEILHVVDEICRRHGIMYSLCGGSVVGAHLYAGCLPWDDDVDLMMTRENYNRFIKVAPQELPNYLEIRNYQTSKEFSSLFTKIIDSRNTIVQADGAISGIFLDITVYDRVPSARFLRLVDIYMWKLSEIIGIGRVEPTSMRKRIRNFGLKYLLPGKRTYFKIFEWVARALSHTKNYTYSELFGAYEQTRPYSPHIFENYAEIRFEDKDYMIIRDRVDYMTTRYQRTDFREPKEKQVAPHYQYVNFDLPWREYIKEANTSHQQSSH